MCILIKEDFLEFVNDENLLRKILLLTIGNFCEGSIDHINIYDLIKDTTLNSFQFEYLNYQEDQEERLS